MDPEDSLRTQDEKAQEQKENPRNPENSSCTGETNLFKYQGSCS